jgi:hypothetical protein
VWANKFSELYKTLESYENLLRIPTEVYDWIENLKNLSGLMLKSSYNFKCSEINLNNEMLTTSEDSSKRISLSDEVNYLRPEANIITKTIPEIKIDTSVN